MSRDLRIGNVFGRAAALGCMASAVCWSVSLGAESAQAAVFGLDARARLPVTDRYFTARVGVLLEPVSGATCTAFCVARDVIATAGHCVNGLADQPKPDVSRFIFRRVVAERTLDAHVAGVRVGTAAQSVITGSERLQTRGMLNAADDWAVIRLERAVCPSGGLRLSSGASQHSTGEGDIYQVAIHSDVKDHALRQSLSCQQPDAVTTTTRDAQLVGRDFSRPGAIILHRCDAATGSSGSPLLINGDDGPEVIAMNVGTYSTRTDAAATAPRETVANTAISAQQFSHAALAMTARTPLQSPLEVRSLQIGLRALGFFAGVASGRSSSALESSVRAFERQMEMRESGVLRRELLDDVIVQVRRTAPGVKARD